MDQSCVNLLSQGEFLNSGMIYILVSPCHTLVCANRCVTHSYVQTDVSDFNLYYLYYFWVDFITCSKKATNLDYQIYYGKDTRRIIL